MTPIGGIADASSILAISTIRVLTIPSILVSVAQRQLTLSLCCERGYVSSFLISAFLMGMPWFRRGEQRKDDDPAEKTYVNGNKKIIEEVKFINIDDLEAALVAA